jgi:hypothetical protein
LHGIAAPLDELEEERSPLEEPLDDDELDEVDPLDDEPPLDELDDELPPELDPPPSWVATGPASPASCAASPSPSDGSVGENSDPTQPVRGNRSARRTTNRVMASTLVSYSVLRQIDAQDAPRMKKNRDPT